MLWFAGFACLWIPVLDDPPLRTDAYLVDVSADGAMIGLITAAPERVRAKVRDATGREVATIDSAAGGDDGIGEAQRRHWFPVRGLAAATTYDYELRSEGGEVWSGRIRTPSTDDRAPVKFAFLGDSGDQPWWVWLQTSPILHWPARWGWFGGASAVGQVGAAVAACQPDFLLHLGDVIYPKGLHAHYRSGFFLPFGPVLREAPVYAVLGNHDVMDVAGLQCLANLHAASPAYRGDGRNFSFARGPVRVIGLDLCATDPAGNPYVRGFPAEQFLVHELEACTEPWIVVASHFPMRSWSRQDNRGDLLDALLPELTKHAVSLYLSGHDHCYQRFDGKDGAPPLVVSGGGGKDLYDIAPAKLGPRPVTVAKAHHWGLIEVSGGRMAVVARGLDGVEIDRFEVELPAGKALERVAQRSPKRAARIAAIRR